MREQAKGLPREGHRGGSELLGDHMVGIAGTFAAVVVALSDVYDTLVFSANF